MLTLRQSIEARVLQFNEAIKTAKSDNVALELLRDKKRFLCQNDLYYLCCLTKNDEIAKYPDYYRPFCDEVSLMNWKIVNLGMHKPNMYMLKVDEVTDNPKIDLNFMQRLYLCYRTFYKTTIITKLHSLQLLLSFPNIHIVLAHNKQENSSDNLVSIKNYFLTTDLRYLFPKYIPETKDWGNMSGFSVACRTDKGRSEENIEAVGVDTEITGRHYQVAKKNDLVTEKSINTEEQIKKTMDWDERFNVGMFDDPQIKLQDYEGTRYHFSDLYSVKLNDPKIKFIDIPLLKDRNPDNVTVENISNPKRFSIEGIQELKKNMWVFNCQLLLKPDDPARMQFKKEMIAYYDTIPQGSNFYLLVDPASRRKKRNDWTVMLIIGLGWFEGKVRKFIVDGLRDKLDPKQRVDMAIALAKKWNIKGCGWEAIGFQETDCFYLEEVRRKERLYFTLEEIDSHKVSKEDRIQSLIPDYAQHNWLWPQKGVIERMSFLDGRKFDLTTEMEFEMLQFPLCEHDDLCLVAGTKIMTLFGNKNIEDIKIGDKVITPFGIDTVIASKLTGYKNVIDKIGLMGTPNHKIFTYNEGEKTLDTLTFCDILSILSQKEMLKWTYRKLLFLIERNTDLWGRENIILASQIPIKEEKILKDFMWRFGNFIIKRKFLLAMKFIIKTIIHLIMNLVIWNVYQLGNIVNKFIFYLLNKKEECLNIWKKLGLLQEFGILLKRAEYGIAKMLNSNGRIKNLLDRNVLDAENLSLVGSPEEKINSVRMFADKDIIRKQDYGMKNVNVLFVNENLPYRNIPQEKLAQKPANIQKVYNLTVKNNGLYYANGILVSNCDTMTFMNRINTVNPEEIKTIPDSHEMTFGEYVAIRDDRLREFNRNPWNRLKTGIRV